MRTLTEHNAAVEDLPVRRKRRESAARAKDSSRFASVCCDMCGRQLRFVGPPGPRSQVACPHCGELGELLCNAELDRAVSPADMTAAEVLHQLSFDMVGVDGTPERNAVCQRVLLWRSKHQIGMQEASGVMRVDFGDHARSDHPLLTADDTVALQDHEATVRGWLREQGYETVPPMGEPPTGAEQDAEAAMAKKTASKLPRIVRFQGHVLRRQEELPLDRNPNSYSATVRASNGWVWSMRLWEEGPVGGGCWYFSVLATDTGGHRQGSSLKSGADRSRCLRETTKVLNEEYAALAELFPE